MKRLSYWSIIGLLLGSYSAFAAVPVNGWYAGLIAGFSYSPSIRPHVSNPLDIVVGSSFPLVITGLDFPGNTSISYGLGGAGGGQVGYRLCNFRLEGELLYNYDPFQKLQFNNFTIKRHYSTHLIPFIDPIRNVRLNGHTSFGAGLINLYYDIFDEDDDPSFIPYIGLGVGYAAVQNSLTFEVLNTINSRETSFVFKRNGNSMIGQAIVGLGYLYSDELALNLDYRFLSTGTIQRFQTRVQAHTLNIGFNYTFYETE